MSDEYEDRVMGHYREQAAKEGLKPTSTMTDQIVREREMDGILRWSEALLRGIPSPGILDVGCGNGLTLAALRERFPTARLSGRDYCREMVDLALQRSIPECEVRFGDVRAIDAPPASLDLVVSQRCIINLLDRQDQRKAFRSVHAALRSGGHLIAIEGFSDAHDNLNRARQELGLDPIAMPVHNLWFEPDFFRQATEGLFVPVSAVDPLPGPRFLSSHYFISRVLHAAVTRGPQIPNTEFVKFFSFLPPVGNYAPVQLHVLRKP